MCPAVGIDFMLYGASDKDKTTVQSILNRYKGKPYFDSDIGKGEGAKVIISETLDLPDDVWVCIDLSKKGVMKIISDSRMGIIYYDEPDRQILLEQLVLMVSGHRNVDSDYADIIPILEKGCRFSWAECRDEEIKDCGIQLTRVAMKESETRETEFFIQITSDSLLQSWELFGAYEEMGEFKRLSFVPQVLYAEDDADLSMIALFFPLK